MKNRELQIIFNRLLSCGPSRLRRPVAGEIMSIKIAVATDLHYARAKNAALPERAGEIADILLHRFLKMLELVEHPDAVIFGGDLVDAADSELLAVLADKINRLSIPYLVIRGNHDPADFYRHFPEVSDMITVNHVRLVAFDDEERPGYNAYRNSREMAKFDRARQDFDGLIVAAQHVPLSPQNLPYNYTNGDEIFEKMREVGCVLSISGHLHAGAETCSYCGTTFVTVPALCESPFRYAVIELGDDGAVKYEIKAFRLPEYFEWIDRHTHSKFAYCSENMDFARQNDLFDKFNLAYAGLAEHSGQMYFRKDDYWNYATWYSQSFDYPDQIRRLSEFCAYFDRHADRRFLKGLEVDIDCHGKLLLAEDVKQFDFAFFLGAIHFVPDYEDKQKVVDEFLFLLDALGKNGIKYVAHPLRMLRKRQIEPRPYFPQIIKIFQEYGMAAEINFHKNMPEPEFVGYALRHGVKLFLGTDSHNIGNFGFLQPHINLLGQIYNGDLREILC